MAQRYKELHDDEAREVNAYAKQHPVNAKSVAIVILQRRHLLSGGVSGAPLLVEMLDQLAAIEEDVRRAALAYDPPLPLPSSER